jgi:enoyl-CoA hydratase/carnithine racemase
MTSADDVLVERRGAIGIVTLNRPQRRNAIRLVGWQMLASAVRDLGAEGEVRVIILRGAGTDAFASGADISEFPTMRGDPERGAVYHAAVEEAFRAVTAVEQPVIAMIHGYCIGGGCELAVACDLRIADERARFGIPAARLGVVLGVDELRALRDLVGVGAAKDILIAGRTLDAAEALRIGLVNQVVPPDELLDTTLELAERIAGYAPVSLAAVKDLLGRIAHGDSPEELAAAHAAFSRRAFATPGHDVGVRAFLARDRRPEERG